ncbi:MAG: hypothetical protein ACYC6A_18240 [Armatimonadota bacterium]
MAKQIEQAGVWDSGWTALLRVGGVAALLVLLPALLDIAIAFFPWGGAPEPGDATISEWFTWLQASPFLALRALGLWNIITLTLGVPVFFALYGAQRPSALAALALLFFSIGTAIYIANNPAIPLLHLSRQYLTASAPQQAAILAAGQALLARGEDWTPGFFPGFFLTHLAGILMALAMFRNRTFSKVTAWIGLWGWMLSLIFLVWYTFIPAFGTLALLISMVGGLLLLTWYVLIARRLFGLFR